MNANNDNAEAPMWEGMRNIERKKQIDWTALDNAG